MNVLRSAALAFSAFSKIPMPQVEWREENMRWMMCFFPLIGVAIALVLAAWFWICGAAGFGSVLFAAGVALLPVAVTGGIHLDGFCDVVDAQSSHAEPERKREILKDPHTGAFASMGVAAYLVLYTAIATELSPDWRIAVLLGGMHVASRCLSGLATILFPTSASKGMLSMFHEAGSKRVVAVVLVIELVACALVMAFGGTVPAACAMLACGLMCWALLFPFAKTQFGGMSGDLAGFFLQVAELVMLAALVVVVKVVGL